MTPASSNRRRIWSMIGVMVMAWGVTFPMWTQTYVERPNPALLALALAAFAVVGLLWGRAMPHAWWVAAGIPLVGPWLPIVAIYLIGFGVEAVGRSLTAFTLVPVAMQLAISVACLLGAWRGRGKASLGRSGAAPARAGAHAG